MNLDELLKAAITDPSKRSVFLQTLIKSDVYVICKNPVKQERGRSEGGVKLELITTQNPDGEVFIPFFTSFRALQQFAKRYVDCYKINCLRLFDLIQSVSAVSMAGKVGHEQSRENNSSDKDRQTGTNTFPKVLQQEVEEIQSNTVHYKTVTYGKDSRLHPFEYLTRNYSEI